MYQREASISKTIDKTHYRAIFLSDIHLGTKGCQADRLLSFLKTHTCDRLFLVGDIIDGWRLKGSFYWPQAHTNVMRRFLNVSAPATEVSLKCFTSRLFSTCGPAHMSVKSPCR